MKVFYAWLSLILLSNFCFSQDIHFSQFYNSALNLSPAKTGIFNGDGRLTAGHRSQWTSVPVPWTSFTVAYDKKLIPKYDAITKSFFSWGLLLNQDEASNMSEIKLTNINLTGSYTALLDEKNLLTLGAQIGYAGKGFNQNTLTWDVQWNDTEFFFDNRINSTEDFLADRINFIEIGIGLNYRYQYDNRTNVEIGVGIYHLNKPSVGFSNSDDISLASRYTVSILCNFEASSKFDFQIHSLAQFQLPYREYVVGALGKIHISSDLGKKLQVHIGMGYRTTDSIFPTVGIQYNNLYGSVSYDIDLTDFSEGKDARLNALEIQFELRISNPKREKVCPVY